jgi:lysozyme
MLRNVTYSGAYGIWQYSSSGRVNGINGNVDMDISYQDYPSIIKAGGFNGYQNAGSSQLAPPQPIAPVQPRKSVDELAREVLEGKWGNGDDRKNRITTAGYDYAAVQAKVNELLKAQSRIRLSTIRCREVIRSLRLPRESMARA